MILNPVSMLVIGLLLGIVSRLLDIYTTNLGNIFSQLAIWILFGVIISIYSDTKLKAMVNVFLFCVGMLITYYLTAVITDGVYSGIMIAGWTMFALCSPILAALTRYTKERGIIPKMIGMGIIAVSVLSSIILFDGFRFYDLIIDCVLVYLLFIKRVKR